MTYEYQGVAVPARIMEALGRYIDGHIATGSFLRAVLENDLKGALGRADPECRAALHAIVAYLYNEAPGDCWGSKEAVRDWLAARHADEDPVVAGHDPDRQVDGDGEAL